MSTTINHRTDTAASCDEVYLIGVDGTEHRCDQPAGHDGLHGSDPDTIRVERPAGLTDQQWSRLSGLITARYERLLREAGVQR